MAQLGSSRDVEVFLESGSNLDRGIMVKGYIFPYAFRRPGSMALYVLQIHICIKGIGGT